jgi:hypothetical protein
MCQWKNGANTGNLTELSAPQSVARAMSFYN